MLTTDRGLWNTAGYIPILFTGQCLVYEYEVYPVLYHFNFGIGIFKYT